MGRGRNKENQGLPERWQLTHGAYYYRVPPGLEAHWDGKRRFRLGNKLNEAYEVWASRLAKAAATSAQGNDDPLSRIRTIGDLLDHYALAVIPSKSAASQVSNRNQLPWLKKAFGSMPLEPFQPKLVYQYVTRRSEKKTNSQTGRLVGGKVAAHREIELLSHAYTKAVEWGLIDRHPFKGEIRLVGEKPRDRYVEDWEIVEALALVPRRRSGSVLMIQAYLRIKLLTGMAQGDLLRLKPDHHFKDEGILIQRHKTQASTGKSTLYRWTPELRAAIELARLARPRKDSTFLFCTRVGAGYVKESVGRSSGWKSMWQRFMERVLTETKVKEPFTEHDLRAKVASDATSLEHARALLAHADSRTTNRVYRRRAEVVSPLR